MSEPHSTPPARPAKPSPDFPLFAHASGQWAKKIRGKMHYFGLWADPAAALAKYTEQAEQLHNGTAAPAGTPAALTLKELCNAFLNAKAAAIEAGELSPRTFADYQRDCELLVKQFGKRRPVADLSPDDFARLRVAMTSHWGPARVGVSICRIRGVFGFGARNELLDKPVRFGSGFVKPSKRVMRKHRAAQGVKLFTAAEVRAMVEGALVVGKDGPELVQPGPQLRAMILLGVNAGLGNSDIGNLSQSALDLDAGIIDFPHPKTGIPRRCPLWPETVQALRDALDLRPEPKRQAHAALVFVTKYGLPWVVNTGTDCVTYECRRLLRRLGINGRQGLGFYTLRHTFRTVADEARDQPAADFIMGHEVASMSSVYRETISDARLRAVAEHVRAWLFGSPAGPVE
jgi:integrase